MWYNEYAFLIAMPRRLAFTLVELLIVIGLTVAMALMAVPLYVNWQAHSALATGVQEAVAALREAQTRAMAGDGGRPWGVYFDDAPGSGSDRFVLFRGATYVARDADYDRATVLPAAVAYGSVSLSGGNAVVFSRIRGTTGNGGRVTLQSSDGRAVEIQVNAAGAVQAPPTTSLFVIEYAVVSPSPFRNRIR